MVRRVVLLAGLLGVLALLLPVGQPFALASESSCTKVDEYAGTCVTGNLTDGEAVLEGTKGSPGADGIGESGGGGPEIILPIDPNAHCKVVVGDRCRFNVDHGEEETPLISLTDIAAFRPDAGVDNMEPRGWMIVGLDTNFFATGGVQVKNGTLLEQPASVRFTPTKWHWVYGDGDRSAESTPGGTWASQGISEFDPTPTSHIYRAAGTYFIDLTIDYTAEYRFGDGPWLGIRGVLPVPANRLTATAGSAKTVLVQHECTANPGGPGC